MNTITGPIALLKQGWQLFINHKKILVPIALLPTIISVISSLLILTKSLPLGLVGFLVAIVGIVYSIAMMPAMVNAIHRLSTEPQAVLSIKSQYSIGFSLFWSALLIGIIVTLVAVGSYVLLIIPGIIVSGFVCLYTFTFVIDGKRGFSVLTESYSLVKGRWWAVFGRLIVVAIVMIICWSIISLIIVGISYLTGMPLDVVTETKETVQTTFGSIMNMVTNIIANGLLLPISLGAMYSLYIALKSTRQAEVVTKPFKNWLIAFLCVGILVPLVIFVSIVVVSLNEARQKAAELRSSGQYDVTVVSTTTQQ